jgi:hypothetical protein
MPRSKPESIGIFIATTISSNVAVLRTLPEMPMSASETRGCCSARQVKTVTHVVELPNLVQDRIRMHGLRGFPESLTTRGGTVGQFVGDDELGICHSGRRS